MSEKATPTDPRAVKCECGHMRASHVINFAKDGRDYCNMLECMCRNYQPIGHIE